MGPKVGERASRLGTWLRRAGTPYVVFAVAALCFFAATLYTDMRVRELAGVSVDSSRNALPSVLHLSAIRAELRQLEREPRAAPAEVDAILRAIDENQRAYLVTPMYADEGALWAQARPHIDAVREAARARAASLEAPDPARAAAAAATLGAAVLRADSDLDELVQLNAAHGERAAKRFDVLETRISETAFALDALSFFLSLCATVLAYRAARRYARYVEERVTELERFADRMAHDVRSPLSPALMALSIVANDFPADHPRQRVLLRGIKSLKVATSIIEALLAFARSGARPSPGEQTNVAEAVRGVLDEASASAVTSDVRLEAEPSDELSVACAPGVLASVLSNLVHNAIKHMGDAEERRVTVRATAQPADVRVEVEDTGPGIPRDLQHAVFDPYVRLAGTSADGLGLGLATVRRLVDAHGGRVGVSSEPGRTRFWFVLPRAKGEEKAPLRLPASPAS